MASRPGTAVAFAAVEHSAVRQPSERYRRVTLPVDRLGHIDPDGVREALRAEGDRLGLLHCQWGNHEVATIQPVAEIVAACRAAGVLVHVDAAAAVGHVPVDFANLGADLLSFSAHKFGGPPGIGALLVRRGLRLPPFIVGGDQERARRAGMENVAAIAGFGAAAAAVHESLDIEAATARAQTNRLLDACCNVAGVVAFGDTSDAGRLPHLVCISVGGVEAEAVLLGLDQAGVAAHSGSACSSEALQPSPVLEAMGVDAERSLRLSVGWSTTHEDIDAAITVFPGVVDRLRSLAPRG